MITRRLRRTLSPRSAGRVLLVVLAGVWVILLNNARIGDNVPDHVQYSWFSIPREARLLETAILLAAFALLQPRLLRSRIRFIDGLILAFIAASLLGIWRMPTSLSSQFQGVYVHVAPFLIFSLAWEASLPRRLITGFIAGFGACVVASLAVGLLVQLPAMGVKGDWVHGYFGDAHVFGTFLAVGSCTLFSLFLKEGNVGFALGSAALLAASYFPANEKVIIFNALWIGAATAWRLLTHPAGWRGWAAAAAIAAGAAGVAAAGTPDGEVLIRTDLLRGRDVTEFGPVKAWIYAWEAVEESPLTMVVGLGPGNFAGLAAVRAAEERPASLSAFSRAAREVLDQRPVAGMAWVSNTWSNLLAEFGFLGSTIFVAILGAIVVPIWFWKTTTTHDGRIRILFFAMLAVIVWQGAASVYTNWAEAVLVFPTMVVGAYCYRGGSSATERTDLAAVDAPSGRAAI
jgi:hypothetical protein